MDVAWLAAIGAEFSIELRAAIGAGALAIAGLCGVLAVDHRSSQTGRYSRSGGLDLPDHIRRHLQPASNAAGLLKLNTQTDDAKPIGGSVLNLLRTA